MKISSFILLVITSGITAVFCTSCTPEVGCTDRYAVNYNPYAELDDGSCIYKGCTDPDGMNYDPNATIDDGNCTFEGSVVFWNGETTSAGLLNDGAISLTYYVDGKIIGSSATNVYWTGAPDCDQGGSASVTKFLGEYKTQAYSFSVIDQRGWEYYDGVININANKCLRFELGWSKKKNKLILDN